MNPIYKVRNWGNEHHPKILDLIRMLLGLLFITKGYVFLNNTGYLRYMIIESKIIHLPEEFISFLVYTVPYVHLVGGVLIFLGLFTRIAAVCQLPIIVGAVFMVNILSSFVNSELWLSIMTLVLLVLYIVIGSGPISLDRLLSGIKTED